MTSEHVAILVWLGPGLIYASLLLACLVGDGVPVLRLVVLRQALLVWALWPLVLIGQGVAVVRGRMRR